MLRLLLAFAALSISAFGSITLNLEGRLGVSNGNPLPNGSLILLVADTAADGFDAVLPTGDFAINSLFAGSNDDTIVARFSMDDNNTGEPGYFFETSATSGLVLGGANGWTTGDPLRLYWFTRPNVSSPGPQPGNSYGIAGLPNTPADGGIFGSADGFSAPNPLGNTNLPANLTVVPEPTSFLSAILGLGLLVMKRRRRA